MKAWTPSSGMFALKGLGRTVAAEVMVVKRRFEHALGDIGASRCHAAESQC